MESLRNFELPAQMSPCLRLFIESLFDNVGVKPGASLYAGGDGQPALPKPAVARQIDNRYQDMTNTSLFFSTTPHAGMQENAKESNPMPNKINILGIRVAAMSLVVLLFGAQIAMSQTPSARGVKNILLVHGGFVDGSGWNEVYATLKQKGYSVTIVQNPTLSLADDVAVTRRAIAAQEGPVILVGHSYGGVVITEAGSDPKAAGLVYIAAFAPDHGESVEALIKNTPPGVPVPPILPPQDGFLFLDRSKFAASFAADVNPRLASFMADSQAPWGVAALSGTVSEPAWRSKPSWYLVSTEDKMIPPAAQRTMSKRAGAKLVEIRGSHAVYVSQPEAVASLIERAANDSTPPGK